MRPAKKWNPATVIARVFTERDSAEIRNLANQISRKPGTVLFAVYAPATALILPG